MTPPLFFSPREEYLVRSKARSRRKRVASTRRRALAIRVSRSRGVSEREIARRPRRACLSKWSGFTSSTTSSMGSLVSCAASTLAPFRRNGDTTTSIYEIRTPRRRRVDTSSRRRGPYSIGPVNWETVESHAACRAPSGAESSVTLLSPPERPKLEIRDPTMRESRDTKSRETKSDEIATREISKSTYSDA